MKKMKRPFHCISDVQNLKGKRVLVRSSLNAPLHTDGTLVNDFRLKKALETIHYLSKKGARVIVMGHIGRDPESSIVPIFAYFKKYINISLCKKIVGRKTIDAIERMHDGDVLLLENLRQHPGETANDFHFAEELAQLADVYINDAFSVSHRNHASITGITKFLPSYAGIIFEEEYDRLSEVIKPIHPALFILGGAKFATKEPLVKKFLDVYDYVFVGGALSNDFYMKQGLEVGVSLISGPSPDIDSIVDHKNLRLPIDVTVLTKEGTHELKSPKDLLPTDKINDCGPKTIKMLDQLILKAKFIVWNGLVGDYQTGFGKHTLLLAEKVKKGKVKTIIGGGDTVSFLAKHDMLDDFIFASTAGGAMLAFLMDQNIPGVVSLSESPKNKHK